MKNKKLRALAAAGAAALALASVPASMGARADWQKLGYLGDLDRDQSLGMNDLVILSRHLLAQSPLTKENCYQVSGRELRIGEGESFQPGEYLENADLDQNGKVNVFDLILLRQSIAEQNGREVWEYFEEQQKEFISPPVSAVKGYLPSQGQAKLVILYVDFPDCPYNYAPSPEEIDEIAFGDEDTTDPNYPFDSMTAFYKRSSKGAMELSGKTFRYTAQKNLAEYNDVAGRQALVKEALKAFEDQADFTEFDGDNDGFIDTTLLAVPTAAGDDNWWPCAGPVDDYNFSVDGKMIGHIITSNAQIESADNYYNFVSTHLHEMGHCMGLPDYYLFGTNDSEGMHGTAGSELMDTDATSDFSCVSKLQLGWYTKDQIQVFDQSQTSATFTLNNAQTDSGNVVVIPCGDLDEDYHSEYMLVEYTTKEGNNSKPAWFVNMGEGIRVYHVDATILDNGWWTSYKYASGAADTNNDQGRRLLRIIDDRDVDNLYRTGDVIDGSISGFHWYDGSGAQSVDTGVTISVGELSDGAYQITVDRK
ncbi:MAG: hypothetical protein IJ071_10130 [Ruminococcus sp.]|nr:hypothetical protein [Ruminococcus sp.]